MYVVVLGREQEQGAGSREQAGEHDIVVSTIPVSDECEYSSR